MGKYALGATKVAAQIEDVGAMKLPQRPSKTPY